MGIAEFFYIKFQAFFSQKFQNDSNKYYKLHVFFDFQQLLKKIKIMLTILSENLKNKQNGFWKSSPQTLSKGKGCVLFLSATF